LRYKHQPILSPCCLVNIVCVFAMIPTFQGGRDEHEGRNVAFLQKDSAGVLDDRNSAWSQSMEVPYNAGSAQLTLASERQPASDGHGHGGHNMMPSPMEALFSLAADAKLGAQVARVRLGIDAKFQKACDQAPLLSRLGLKPARVTQGTLNMGWMEAASRPQEELDVNSLIHQFEESQDHLKTVLEALEDYQRHRAGLAEAGHRLGLALIEASQRAPGQPVGEALRTCGTVHKQAATRRDAARAAEELHVVSKLRAHSGKAAADCRRAVRRYECALREVQLMETARREATRAKEVSGDSLLTPTVEGESERAEEASKQRLQSATDEAKAKLSMFQAKHAVDYASSLALHMKSTQAEEGAIRDEFDEIGVAADTILGAVPQALSVAA